MFTKLVFIVAFFACVCVINITAQGVVGRVVDTNGRAISRVKVHVKSSECGAFGHVYGFTGTFGYFKIMIPDDCESIVIWAEHKRYLFGFYEVVPCDCFFIFTGSPNFID